MTLDRPKLTVIIASTRSGRFGPTVARWFAEVARTEETFDVDLVDLADHDLPASFEPAPGTRRFAGRIGAADAFVIVTPEYNHSFPGQLKIALDSLLDEWRAKPVAFVSYGGLSGGLRAVEALRPIAAELHMVSIRATVSFHRGGFGEDGSPLAPEEPAAAAKELLGQLAWWAGALRQGRAHAPYPA